MSSTARRGWLASTADKAVAWTRRLSLDEWAVVGIGALALVSRLALLGVYSAEYDEGVYWQSLRAMAAGHALYRQVFSSQPPLFLLAVYPFYRLLGETLTAARFGVMLYSLAGIAALYVAGRLSGGRWAGAIVAALLAVDPLYLHASVTLEAEGPSVALSCAAVALALAAVRSRSTHRRWLAVGAGAALMAAMLIKLFAVVTIVPVVVILAAPLLTSPLAGEKSQNPLAARERRQGERSSSRDYFTWLRAAMPDLAWCAAGLLGAALVVLLPFAPSWGDMFRQSLGFHLAAGTTTGGGLRAHWQTIGDTLGWLPLALPSLAAVALLWWRRVWALVPPLLWAVAALVLLLRLQPLFVHHVVLLAPPLALAGGIAIERALREVTRLRVNGAGNVQVVRLAAGCLLALALLAGARDSAGEMTAARQYVPSAQLRMAAALEASTAPRDTVVSDDPYVAALADRSVPPQLVDTSSVRIASGYLTAAQVEAIAIGSNARAILFASGRFDQIAGFRGWVAAHYRLAQTFGNGRALYLCQAR